MKLSRTFAIEFDRAKIDKENRTVDVCFSSESPVDRGGYDEILDHGDGSVDLTRLNNAHPLLLNHSPDKQIGVVESAWIDGDKRGRAKVRFGRSPLAEEIFQDVQDGIRRLMSVGYERTREISSETDQSGRKSIRFGWRPFEVSIVPVPADTEAGIGRSQVCPTCGAAVDGKLSDAGLEPKRDDEDGDGDEDDENSEDENDGTVIDPDPRCRPDSPIPNPVLKPEIRCRVDG